MHDICLAGSASLQHEWQALVVAGRSLDMMLALSVVLSPLLAPVFLWAYRRRVIRYMNLQQPGPAGVVQPQAPAETARAPAPKESLQALSPFVAARYRRVRFATWAAYAVFCVGALVLAVFTAPDGGGGLWQLPLATAFLALGPALVNLRPQASPQVRAAFVLGALGIAVIVAADPVYWGNATGDYMINNTADTVLGALMTFALCAMCMHRKVRTQLLPTALALWWGFSTCVVVTATLEANACAAPFAAEVGWRIPGLVALYVTIWLMLRLGTGSLSLLGWLFQRGWVSDLSISALTGIAMIATLLCLQVLPGSNAHVGVALAWTAACVLGYGAALQLGKADGPAPRLLVLRVFNSGAVAEQVLDDVQQRWRLAGPVLQIGGPDLAGINVDLFEFSRLLGGRLHEIFVVTVPGFDELQRRLDVDHDSEGRFRVSEVFCIGTAWAGTVAHLIEMADAILLDLRGFAPERKGTLREIEMLAARAAFGRVVMLADERTDLVLARRLFTATPASGKTNEPAQVVTLASKGHDSAAAHRIWDALLAVTEGSHC